MSKQDILNQILKGGWIFNSMLSRMKAQFAHALSEDPGSCSLSYLSTLNYLNMKIPYLLNDNLDEGSRINLNNLIFQKFGENMEFEKNATFERLFEKCHNVVISLYPDLNGLFSKALRVKNGNFCGASSPHAFGIYFAGDKACAISETDLEISIVHEAAHQELFIINMFDRLINVEADGDLKFASFQRKARPPMGRLHALYAVFRMLEFDKIKNENVDHVRLEHFKNMMATLTHDELTEFGVQLLNRIEVRTMQVLAC